MKFDDYSQIEIEIGKDSGKPGRTNPKPPVPPAEPVPPVSEPVPPVSEPVPPVSEPVPPVSEPVPPVSEPVPPVSEPVPPVSEPVPPAAEPQPPYDPYGGQQPPYDPYGGQQPPYDPYGGQQPPYDPYGGQQPPYDPYGGQQPPYDPYGGQRPPYDPYGGQQPPYDPYGGQLKRKKEKKPPVILICVIALVVLAAVVFGVMWAVNGGFGNMFGGDGASNMVTPPAAPSASAVTPPVMQTADPHAVPTAMPTEAPDSEDPQAAEPTPSPTPSAPVNRQVVEVTASGSTGTLVMTQWQDGQWVELMRSAVYLGRNGISQNKVEGDGCTPAGTFDILFYLSTAQYDSKLDFVQVKSGDIWIVDSDSASYNTLQNENNYGDWNPREVEHIYNMFANGMTSARIMFSYNGDGINSGTADRSGGSAIFIDGTASSGELTRGYGDILMTAEEIALLLSYLDSSMDPILVVK